MTTPEDVFGLVKGLADVVHAQQKAQKEALEESNKQINNLANSVKIIAKTKQYGSTWFEVTANKSPEMPWKTRRSL